MGNQIPQSFIDELLARVDIVEIIELYLTLQKAGHEYKACCPFHQEKTPSFTVSPRKQFYYCFGCGAHGNAIKFLMEHQHFGFIESIEFLADRVGVNIPKQHTISAAVKDQTVDLYAVMEKVSQFYRYQLKHHPQKDEAIHYLRERGLTGEICQKFAIGYAPDNDDALLSAFKAYEKELIATGMLSQGKQKKYDRFRHRIMFPIRDRKGQVIAFGGRVLDKEGQPKYLNSPETRIFHKSQELYGLYEALQNSAKLNKLLVVEGYLDVVALAQLGIPYAVATLGTALNVQHLRRLFRLVNQLVFCFDGDSAGQRAAWKALTLSLPMASDDRELRFLVLPPKEDPDSYIRKKGLSIFEQAIEQSQTLTSFLLQGLMQQVDLNSLDGKAKLIKLAEPLLQALPDGARKILLWEQLSTISGMRLGDIKKLHASHAIQKSTQNKIQAPIRKLNKLLTPLQQLISLLLQYPHLVKNLPDNFQIFDQDPADSQILNTLTTLLNKQPNIHTGLLLMQWPQSEQIQYLAALASKEYLLSTEQIEKEMIDLIKKLKNLEIDHQLLQIQQKIMQLGFNNLSFDEKKLLKRLTNKNSDLESNNQ